MAMTHMTQIKLRSRPSGPVTPECFETVISARPTTDELLVGEVLLAAEIISIDPYVRARLEDRSSYKPPTPLGSVIPAEAVSRVLASRSPRFQPGDQVLAYTGWATHAVVHDSSIRSISDAVDSRFALGALGMPGLTGYAGLQEYARLEAGQTLTVAAATGPVGSMVGQLAKVRGLRVVGIAGGQEKCDILTQQLGFDAAVDHRDPNFATTLAEACPSGIDVNFETVGGRVFEAQLPLFNRYGRILVCGLVGQWKPESSPYSSRDLLRVALDRSLSIHGFVVGDLREKYERSFLATVPPLVTSGKVKVLEHVSRGIETCPTALMSMLAGSHVGKTLVEV